MPKQTMFARYAHEVFVVAFCQPPIVLAYPAEAAVHPVVFTSGFGDDTRSCGWNCPGCGEYIKAPPVADQLPNDLGTYNSWRRKHRGTQLAPHLFLEATEGEGLVMVAKWFAGIWLQTVTGDYQINDLRWPTNTNVVPYEAMMEAQRILAESLSTP
ncbi:MAG: hypothetical protein WC773_00035 [Patescibacteria group bacterium]|jgi:hypothetical protein